MTIPRLLIVWHSATGGTRQMVEAAQAGAREEKGADVAVRAAPDATPEEMLAADGYLFAAPENLAAIAGVMKSFYDRCYYPVLGRIEGRPYAQMVCAGSDGENCVRQTARIAKGWRLKAVAEPIIVCTHAQTTEAILAQKTIPEAELTRCRDMGQALAAGLAMGLF
ncbi:flavodoxin family protein [Pacificimonas sp. WHA3]|uniref:Flavodoxin family protein n=1 Tax=Pacificimonas pallii TaxID=2827236 RepID=A0ABS6SCT7_9SPHN|nr:NAD(P)H-dependent oxidoreductase [Pacificimonas pallii]MBV7256228.1 flavodoxin family protein [Pacificimonas pallii]